MKLRTGPPEEAGMDPERVARLHERAKGWAPRLSALSLLAARRGVVFFHENFGRVRPDGNAPLTKDSIFPIMSVTKPFTATQVMLLVEEGLLDINRPVQFYLPEFTGAGKISVAIHHLLTHTSGIDDNAIEVNRFAVPAEAERPLEPTETREMNRAVALTCLLPLARAPGEEHVYSNANYALLQEIVRRVSGKSPEAFARERLFEPLGLSRTSIGLPREREDERVYWPASAYGAENVGGPERPWQGGLNGPGPTRHRGFGGIFSTAWDVAQFGQMFLNGGRYGDVRLLSRGTVELMTRNHTPGLKGKLLDTALSEASVGYGWFVNHPANWPFLGPSLSSPRSYSHMGFGGSQLMVDPDNGLVMVFLSTQHEVWPAMFAYPWEADLFVNMVTSAVADD
jgi:CubicO group peptidase (beta-lactamase class C family)